MKTVVTLLLLASSFGFAQPKGSSTPAHRVVIEINSADHETWGMALRNISNLQQSFGAAHIEIEAVVLGKGIDLVLGSDAEYADRLGALSHSGVMVWTEPDRTMMAKTDGFLPVACLRTFIAAHRYFLGSFLL